MRLWEEKEAPSGVSFLKGPPCFVAFSLDFFVVVPFFFFKETNFATSRTPVRKRNSLNYPVIVAFWLRCFLSRVHRLILRTASCCRILRSSAETLPFSGRGKKRYNSNELEYNSWGLQEGGGEEIITTIHMYLYIYILCLSVSIKAMGYKHVDVHGFSVKLDCKKRKRLNFCFFSVSTMIHDNRHWCYFCINIISSMWHAWHIYKKKLVVLKQYVRPGAIDCVVFCVA